MWQYTQKGVNRYINPPKIEVTTMPMRQLKIRKRVIKREEQISMHESAKAAAERYHQEKQRLIAEGKLRREFIKVDAKTTIVRYIPIDDTTSQ